MKIICILDTLCPKKIANIGILLQNKGISGLTSNTLLAGWFPQITCRRHKVYIDGSRAVVV